MTMPLCKHPILLFALFMLTYFSSNANHVLLTIQNPSHTATTMEFDVFIENDGGTTLSLGGYQFGINFNLAILNGGTPATGAYIQLPNTRDIVFNSLNTPSIQYNNQQLRVVSTTVSAINSVPLPTGTQYRLGRFRFTNTVNWLNCGTPNLSFQLLVAAGKTVCVAPSFIGSATTSTALSFSTSTLNAINNVPGFSLCLALPVSLLSFEGLQSGNADILRWTTSSEEKNSHFNLQSANDGILFQTIARINSEATGGKSNEMIRYQFINTTPQAGETFYRLEQVDIDGKKEIVSNTIRLYRETAIQMTISPNPAIDEVSVSIRTGEKRRLSIQCIDMKGTVMRQQQILASAGISKTTVDISSLPAAQYLIRIIEGDSVLLTEKFLKQTQ